MPTLLLSADLHLGRRAAAAAAGSAAGAGAGFGPEPDLLRASAGWLRLARLAADSRAGAVLLAGDVVDEASGFFEAFEALAAGLSLLRDHDIPVVVTAGNHDFEVLPALLRQLNLPNVHFLGEGGQWSGITLSLSGTEIQFVGWSFPARHVYDDPLLSLPADLLRNDIPVIGLVHGDYAVRESSYAPLSPARMQQAGVTAWVTGHIHKPAVLQSSGPFIAYPGSLQALSPKETGPHGAMRLTLEGGRLTHGFIPLSAVRYESLPVPAGDISTETDLRAAVQQSVTDFCRQNEADLGEVSRLVADLRFTGTHPDPEGLQRHIGAVAQEEFRSGGLLVTLRRLVSEARPGLPPLETLAAETGPAGVLAAQLLTLREKPESPESVAFIRRMTEEISAVGRLPVFAPIAGGLPGSTSPETITLIEEEMLRLLTALLRQKEAQHG
ncbi:MAG: DNA repair exonuclease [Balneolales bacterium]|nr:DNA repair exonuclease [Balneolales bacterium]